MAKRLQFQEMLEKLRQSLEAVPEHRTGRNTRYRISDAGLGAFSVFYVQLKKFLAHQRDMQRQKGQNNAYSLFAVRRIPSDQQIRNLLDPVEAEHLYELFWGIYHSLEEEGHLDKYQGVGGTRLISLDGTQYFSSQEIHCSNCRVSVREEKTYYSHLMMMAVVCAPEQKHVICLEPEFITPQDGHEKQDCELQATKRWIERNAERFEPWRVTILADDLHCHEPTCKLLLKHKMHFIITCKSESHKALYEELALLERVEGAISTKVVRKWNGRYHERWVYRWVESLPLRRGPKALQVNWCELTVSNEATERQLYHNAWATDHTLNEQLVVEVAASGRSRWKVENEGFNVLKNRGYNFEHNYGHGQQHLSTVLLTLLLLAFLFHTALDLSCLMYQAVRSELAVRRTFFDDLRALTRYLYFASWQDMLTFMYQRLDLAP